MEKSREELQQEINMLRQEIRVAREAAQTTADFVVRQFEQTERMLHRFQVANAERQAVLDAATQLSIIATDLDGTIRLFSKGAATLLGYRPTEMIGTRTILSLHLPEELQRYGEKISGVGGSLLRGMEVFDQIVKQKQSRAREWVYLRKDGTHLPVSLSVTQLLNPDGRVAGYLFAAMDMTLQKEMEGALIEAKEAAESANASKGDFLARMSHEIRTPMNGIIGMASLLEKTALESKQRNYVEKLIGSANTLLHLINDILDFSKIDAGRLHLEKVLFNLEDILGNVANVVGMQAEKKGLEFLFRVDPQVPHQLIGDPLRLGQILMNLAGNAVKFTERGEIVISVGLERRQGNDLAIRFSVKDSGIGLATEQIGSLFSAFSQADDSITRRYGGTGLGLAICKQLTELMGGTIRVESEPGKGAEFIFTARLQCPERQSLARPRLLEQLGGLRALVVDDNSIARDVLASMLRSLKIEVDTAVDGESAIALLEEQTRAGQSYDVILLDWIMPGIDGIETARRIKANAEIARIPAMLMVTANAREDAYVEAKNAGLDAFLLKPVYASIMHDTLLDIIGLETGSEVNGGTERNQQVDLDDISGARILLVDDNVINQEVAAEFLHNVGMAVTIAGNGRQALQVLEEQSFDLVLMDIQMPEMDGLEATRRIRRKPLLRNLPIIAMTAHAMTGDRDKSLAAGMNDHITKPIDQKILYQA
ncbi:MAG: response regulator, partial [Desulfofustis sp.]|nr:response regulator [Desulfofustis sp.]